MKNEEITLKNTKAEILEALNSALEREKNIAKIKSNPEKEEKQKNIQRAIEVSKNNVEQNIFSEELNKKFKDLELAISAEEEKLKNLYGIEKELNDITLVINAGKDCIAEIENKKSTETQNLKDKIEELEESYKLKKEELEKEYDLKAKSLKMEREREQEEYTYKTKRERAIANNNWEDEKNKRELEIARAQEETKKLLEDAKNNEEYLKSLEIKVEEMPALLDEKYNKGRKDAEMELKKDHEYAIQLLTKDFNNTIDRQNDKIESLKEELQKANELNSKLQEKMDKAYVELKELATKTVEASGGVKILGNATNDGNK